MFLAGVQVSPTSLSVALQFTPDRPVRNWKASRKLAYGNLLCLSPTQKFGEDVIWATVSERDDDVLDKSNIIFVEICEFNTVPLAEAIRELLFHGGQTVMVESPTYFNSTEPVLQARHYS